MSPDAFGYAVGALLSLVAAIYSGRVSIRAHRISTAIEKNRVENEKIKVDGAAYERAQKINQQVVDELSKELARLQKELNDFRRKLHTETTRNAELERQLNELQRTMNRMTRLLQQNNIPFVAEA